MRLLVGAKEIDAPGTEPAPAHSTLDGKATLELGERCAAIGAVKSEKFLLDKNFAFTALADHYRRWGFSFVHAPLEKEFTLMLNTTTILFCCRGFLSAQQLEAHLIGGVEGVASDCWAPQLADRSEGCGRTGAATGDLVAPRNDHILEAIRAQGMCTRVTKWAWTVTADDTRNAHDADLLQFIPLCNIIGSGADASHFRSLVLVLPLSQ